MSKTILTFYGFVLCFSAIIGLVRYKQLDGASKLLVWYLISTFLTEGTGLIMALILKQPNVFLFHFYSPFQFLLLSLYFNFSDERQTIYKAGWIVGIAGIIISIVNSIYFQPLRELNTNFIVVESFLVIAMSLVAFYRLLISDDIAIFSLPRFWFSAIFLVFWSFTFFYWLVGAFIYNAMPGNTTWLKMMIWSINIVTYSALAGVFLSYKKIRPA